MKSKIIIYLVIASIFLTVTSCGKAAEMDGSYLKNITEYYRLNGMTDWHEILAVYNADENPLDYKGFDEIAAKLADGGTTEDMAAYLIISGVAADIGADISYFLDEEETENFVPALKAKIEACDGSEAINVYALMYYGLKACNITFADFVFAQYLQANQCADGGFAYSGDTGNVELTALILPVLRYSNALETYEKALKFIENSISSGTKNASSTASALSALICANSETVETAKDGLAAFTVKSADGFASGKGGKRDETATYNGAITLGDYNKKSCLFYNLLNIELDSDE